MKENVFEKAAAWIRSKKDFAEGIAILHESGFRPSVVRKLARDGAEGPAAAERLEFNMREFVKAYGIKTDVPDTDPELHVFEGEESPADTPEEKQLGVMASDKALDDGELQIADQNAVKVIHEYAAAYRRREKAMRLMAEVGESNDQESMDKRKALSDEIDECSSLMERLYPLFERHQSGSDISEEEIGNAMQTAADAPDTSSEKSDATGSGADHTSEACDFEGKSREELVQLKKNAQSRVIKAKNRLEYQSEKKEEKPNPMPEGPKRVKLETKIANEEKLIEAIDMAIAKFG